MSALNNLRKKGTSLTLGKNEHLAERVESYPILTIKPLKNIRKTMWSKMHEKRC